MIFIFHLSACAQQTNKDIEFPDYVGYVNDFEGLFTEQQAAELDSIIRAFNKATSNQIAVVTIESIAPFTSIDEFTTALGNYWGLAWQKWTMVY